MLRSEASGHMPNIRRDASLETLQGPNIWVIFHMVNALLAQPLTPTKLVASVCSQRIDLLHRRQLEHSFEKPRKTMAHANNARDPRVLLLEVLECPLVNIRAIQYDASELAKQLQLLLVGLVRCASSLVASRVSSSSSSSS